MRSAGLWRRLIDAPLWAHGAALASALLVLLPVIGTGTLFVSDEGAVQAQVDLVTERGEWTLANEQPELDPDLEALPIDRAERTEDGRWAPYSKQPLYVAVLSALDGPLGDAAPAVLGIVGVVAAAAAAAVLARGVDAALAVPALWLTGIGTPLLFDAYLTMAHAAAAGLGGWAAVLALRRQHGTLLSAVGAAVLVALAVSVRAEGTLFGIALAVGVLAVGAVQDDRTGPAVVGVAIAVAAVAARELNDVAVEAVMDGPAFGTPAIAGAGSGEFVADRISGFRLTMLSPHYGELTAEGTALLVAAVLVAVAAVLARRRPGEPLVAALPVIAVVLVVFRSTLSSATVPGLLLAAPWLLAGWVGLRRADGRQPIVLGATVAWAVFAGAVLVTQYGIGGGGEWGGRYFAVGLPVAVVPAVVGLRNLASTIGKPNRHVAAAGLAAVTLLLGALAVTVHASAHTRVDDLRAGVAAARRSASPDGEPVPVVGTSGFLGRAVWRPGDPGPFFSAAGERLTALFDRLEAAAVERVLVVSRNPAADAAAIGPAWTVAGDDGLGSGWHALTLRAS